MIFGDGLAVSIGTLILGGAMKYYEEHEVAYQNLKKNGYVGWGKKKSVEEMMAFSQRSEIESVLQSRTFPLNPRALDLGCGTGPISFYLSEKGFKSLGVDISKTAVIEARKIASELKLDAEFVVADIVHETLPYDKFQIISDSSFLHCIVFEDERQACLNKIFDFLDNNGLFILHTMVSDRAIDFGSDFELDEQGVLWYLSKDARTRDSIVHASGCWATPQRRILTADRIRQQMIAVGFKELQTKYLYEENKSEPLTLFGVYSR
ncbi:class I SAM-dependent methyltransferase [Bdellovibrio sp. HCB337]|uniref:class I SAM-dependent methyltransferase n=1 Tax=Bdellovibrio sp. HCB337 TaxID=3394358 RepID=UPI0039A68D7E